MPSISKPQDRFIYRGANSTSSSWSHPVHAGGNRMLRVNVLARNNGTVSAPTYGGVALTLVPGSEIAAGTGTSRRYVSWWYMLAPPVGTATLAITVGSADSGNYGLIVYNDIDVDQTTPFRDQGGGNFAVTDSGTAVTSSTLTPASSPGDLVVSALYSASAPTMAAGQYKEGGAGVSQRALVMSAEATAGTTSIGATMSSNTVVHSAIAIIGDATTQPDPADYTGSRGKKSWVVSGNLAGESLSAGSTLYCALSPTVESSSTASANRTVMRNACTISAPAARVSSNATSGASTYTLQVNGVDSGVSITITAGTTGYFAGSGTASIASGDEVGWKLVTGAGGAVTLTALLCVVEATGSETITLLGVHSSSAGKLTPGESRLTQAYGTRGAAATDERKSITPILIDADWKGLGVTKVGTTTNGTVSGASRVNGTAGNQALSWSSGSTSSQEDTSNTDALVDGDLICMSLASAGSSGDFEYERVFGRLINSDGEFLVMSGAASGNGVSIGAAGTYYLSVGGELGYSATESPTQATVPFDMAAKRLFLQLGQNDSPATADGSITLRVNGADSTLTARFVPQAEHYLVADIDHVVDLSAGDVVSIALVNGTGGTSNTLRLRAAGIVGIERAAAANTLTVSQGSYAVAGQSVNLRAARRMAVTQGAYAISGQPVGLRGARQLAIAQGAYVLAGQSVTLTKSAAGGLVVTQGAYAIAGQPVDLRAARRLAVSQGAYALAGQSVTLTKTAANALAVTPGSYTLNGRPVDLRAARRMAVSQGAYALAGQSVTLTRSGVGYTLAVTPGAYLLGGQPVSLRAARRLAVTRGTYSLSGMPVTLQYSGIEVYDRAPLPINLPRRPKRRIGSLLKEQ